MQDGLWSDMFDPNHNAHADYYLVRGDLKGSWEGLDKDVIIVPWYYEKRAASLKFFADRGHRQLVAGYYDDRPERIRDWLDAAKPFSGILGVMYTTWQGRFGDVEKFAGLVSGYQSRLRLRIDPDGVELEFARETGGVHRIESSTNLVEWEGWAEREGWGTNVWRIALPAGHSQSFYGTLQ